MDELATSPAGLGVSELARRVDLAKSSVHLALTTLASQGVVATDSTSARYRIGPHVLHWSAAFLKSTVIASFAQVFLDRFRDFTGETAHLHLRTGFERICIAQAISHYPLRREATMTTSRPLNRGVVGTVLLASLPGEEVEAYLARDKPVALTPRTPVEASLIVQRVDFVRRNGYVIGIEDTELGAGAIGLSILNASGEVAAALAISGPLARWNEATINEHLQGILALRAEFSQRMGWREVAVG